MPRNPSPRLLAPLLVACAACEGSVPTAPDAAFRLSAAVVSSSFGFLGGPFACGLTTSGETYCWGRIALPPRSDGRPADPTVPVRVPSEVRFRTVVSGSDMACATSVDGTAYCWGRGSEDPHVPRPIDTDLRFKQLSVGDRRTCGVTIEGRVACWGDSFVYSLGDGATESSATPVLIPFDNPVVSISTHWDLTCALDDTGQAFCWGAAFPTDFGQQLGSGTPLPVASGFRFKAFESAAADFCGITLEGDLYCWFGADFKLAHEVNPSYMGSGFAQIAAGSPMCGIRPGGEAVCWSVPVEYRFSDGEQPPDLVTREMPGLSFLSMSGSWGWACGVVQTGPEGAGVYCWGPNHEGQLGIGSRQPSPVPKRNLMPTR